MPVGYYDTPQVVQCAMSSFFKKGLDKIRTVWYNKDNKGVKPMKTEEQIEILMKTFSLEWEQAALITLAIKRMKEGMNNGNYGKV